MKKKWGEQQQQDSCAFCNMELSKHDTEILNTHLSQGSQVNPNCAEVSCLKLNPRANFKDGWTLKLSKKRKRENGAQSKSKKKKKKKKVGAAKPAQSQKSKQKTTRGKWKPSLPKPKPAEPMSDSAISSISKCKSILLVKRRLCFKKC